MADDRRRQLKLSFQADTVKTAPIIKPQSAPDRTRRAKQKCPTLTGYKLFPDNYISIVNKVRLLVNFHIICQIYIHQQI